MTKNLSTNLPFKEGDYVVPVQVPKCWYTYTGGWDSMYRPHLGKVGIVTHHDNCSDRPFLVFGHGYNYSGGLLFNKADLRPATDEEILIYKLTL